MHNKANLRPRSRPSHRIWRRWRGQASPKQHMVKCSAGNRCVARHKVAARVRWTRLRTWYQGHLSVPVRKPTHGISTNHQVDEMARVVAVSPRCTRRSMPPAPPLPCRTRSASGLCSVSCMCVCVHGQCANCLSDKLPASSWCCL